MTAIIMAENKDFELMPHFKWKIKDVFTTIRLKSPIFTVADMKFSMLFQQNCGIIALSMMPEVENEQSTVPSYDIKTAISIMDPDEYVQELLLIQKKTIHNSTGRKQCHLVWDVKKKFLDNFDMLPVENGKKNMTFHGVFGPLAQYPKHEKELENPCYDFDYMNTLGKDLDELRLKEDSSFELKCGDKTIKAHKVILSARSKKFDDMFRNEKATEKEVEIKDMEFEVLENFITYIYSGRLKHSMPSVELLIKLYKSAVEYKVEPLKVMAYSRLIEILNSIELSSDSEILDKEKSSSKEKLSSDPEILNKEKLSNDPEIVNKEKLSSDLDIMDKKKLSHLLLELLYMTDQNKDEKFKKLVINSIVNYNDFILNEVMWEEFREHNPKLAREVYDNYTY